MTQSDGGAPGKDKTDQTVAPEQRSSFRTQTTPTWYSGDQPAPPKAGTAGRALAALRGSLLLVVLVLGLALTLLLRPLERLIWAAGRPLTGWITVAVCRAVLFILGLVVTRHGRPLRSAGVTVANHSSWLDIFVLNAGGPTYFIAKAEVAGWAGIGWLARATGTVFIRRTRTAAQAHVAEVAGRLGTGHQLTLFAEGTSSDGARVLPFKPTLLEALLQARRGDSCHGVLPDLMAQPVSLRYRAPPGRDGRFYGWWGDMDFGPHAVAVLSQWPQGSVEVVYGTPVQMAQHTDRKALARALETAVRDGFEQTGT